MKTKIKIVITALILLCACPLQAEVWTSDYYEIVAFKEAVREDRPPSL